MKNQMKNYIFIGKLNVNEIINFVTNLDQSEWEEETIRQKVFSVHMHTKTVPILWDYESLSYLKVGQERKYFSWFKGTDFFKNLNKKLFEFYGDGTILRILLTKLESKKSIMPHKDGGESLLVPNRIHIPIITNDQVFFSVDDEVKNMKIGEMWEFNNSKIHFVNNFSNEDRVHLIADYYKNTK
jgi:hypothetical protein